MVVVRIQNDEIALFAHFDTSDAMRAIQSSGTVEREGGNRLFDAEIHVNAGKRDGQRYEPEKQLPGFRSVASATAQPASIISRPRA